CRARRIATKRGRLTEMLRASSGVIASPWLWGPCPGTLGDCVSRGELLLLVEQSDESILHGPHRRRVPSWLCAPAGRRAAAARRRGASPTHRARRLPASWRVRPPGDGAPPPRRPGHLRGFSSDGRLLASVGQDWMIRLWDPATGTE